MALFGPPQSTADLIDALTAHKRTVRPHRWVEYFATREKVRNTANQFQLVSQLTSQGVGLAATLRIQCPMHTPNERVGVMLHTQHKGKSRCFARVDWNGSTHENRLRVCGPHRFLNAGPTHFHDPRLLGDAELGEVLDPNLNLPVATPLDRAPRTFKELMVICSDLLHIEGLDEIEEPQWNPSTMFP